MRCLAICGKAVCLCQRGCRPLPLQCAQCAASAPAASVRVYNCVSYSCCHPVGCGRCPFHVRLLHACACGRRCVWSGCMPDCGPDRTVWLGSCAMWNADYAATSQCAAALHETECYRCN
eukprot:XP_001691557.1 predicted protein [Chlamydomonas reinhardtii]